MNKLTFVSTTSILRWAGLEVGKRFGETWYVEKDNLWYYFTKYVDGYQLVMTSSRDITAGE